MKKRNYISLLCLCLACLSALALASCGEEPLQPAESKTETAVETAADTRPESLADTAEDTEGETVGETVDETVDETVGETPGDTGLETPPETEPDAAPPSHVELDFCHYNYECVRSVNEVVADGVYHEEEWAEAVELVINDDTLEDWGRWQQGPALDPAHFSVTFKLKWDEEYLYLLEIRTDANYVYQFGGKGYDVFNDVWGGDATAFFLCDAMYSMREDRCDIGYFTYVDQLDGPAVYVGSFDGESKAFRGPSGTDGCTYGGTFDGERTAVFEMKLPWAIMEKQEKLFSDIEVGTLFRFNPILPSVDTTEGLGTYGEEWRQLNFHDCVDNGEEGNPDDPFYWAALTLVETATETD